MSYMRIIVVFLVLTTTVFSQKNAYYFEVKANLYDHKITAIQQDAHGRLIIGTDKGLFSYNGFNSVPFVLGNLVSKDILFLQAINDKTVGVTRSNQLFEIVGNSVKILQTPEISGKIIKIFQNTNNQLIVVCVNGVFCYHMSPFAFDKKIEVPFYEKGRSELIDLVDFKGVYHGLLSSNELVNFDEQLAMTVPVISANKLVVVDDKLLLFPSINGVQSIFEYRAKRFLFKARLHVKSEINKIVLMKDALAVLAKSGLYLLDKLSLKTNSDIIGVNFTTIFTDRSNTIWLGSSMKGLYCLPKSSFQVISPIDFKTLRLKNDSPIIIAENQTNQVFGIAQNGRIGAIKAPVDVEVSTYFDVPFYFPLVTNNKVVFKVLQQSQHEFLAITSEGLYSFNATNVKAFKNELKRLEQGLFSEKIKEYVISKTNDILLSTVDGLYFYDNMKNQCTKITFFNEEIDAVQIGNYGENWFVLTPNNHVLILDKNKVVKDINFKRNGSGFEVLKIKHFEGYYYCLSSKSIYRTKDLTGKFEQLQALSMLPDMRIRDFVVLRSRVYVATQFGLLRFYWKKVKRDFPNLILGEISGDYQVKGQHLFSPSNTFVSVPFELVELNGNHPFTLQYRLVKNEKIEQATWRNVSNNLTSLSFDHLRAGTYLLEMRIIEPGSNQHSTIKHTQFVIETSWIEDVVVWFIGGVILGFLGFVYYRGHRRLRRYKRLKKRM